MSVDIGERIRSLRTARGLSQEEVARRTGIGLKSYGDLERGRTRDPHYSTLRGVARALGVRVEEVLEEPLPLEPVPLDEAPRETGHSPAAPSEEPVSDEYVIRVPPEVAARAISRVRAGEITKKQAARDIADSVADMDDVVDQILDAEESTRAESEAREGTARTR
jgi:transcriptional regulator with XRE-family HTH domain